MTSDDYTIEDGIIRNPGKFEGEPAYAPYFWDAVLNGECSDEFETWDDQTIAFFKVQDGDIREFPALAGVYGISITNDSRGFVYVQTYDERITYYAAIHAVQNDQREANEGDAECHCRVCGRGCDPGRFCDTHLHLVDDPTWQ